MEIFNAIVDKHAPLKHKRVKRDIQPPWLTQEILLEMKLRDELKCKSDSRLYKDQRNKVITLIRMSKIQFFGKLIENKADPVSIWKAIKLLKNTSSASQASEFTPDDFNTFFTDIGSMASTKFANSLPNFEKLREFTSSKLQGNTQFVIPMISVVDCQNYLRSLKVKKSHGS